jgi:hypothetical protein
MLEVLSLAELQRATKASPEVDKRMGAVLNEMNCTDEQMDEIFGIGFGASRGPSCSRVQTATMSHPNPTALLRRYGCLATCRQKLLG